MKQHWRSNSSFINFVCHIRQLLWAPSLLHSFVLCLVGDCCKIVIFAIFPKFASFTNFYGPPSLLCALPRWRLWQNCHFSHICQIRRFRQLLWAPFTALCFASLAIVAKLSFSPYLPNSPTLSLFRNFCVHFWTCLWWSPDNPLYLAYIHELLEKHQKDLLLSMHSKCSERWFLLQLWPGIHSQS